MLRLIICKQNIQELMKILSGIDCYYLITPNNILHISSNALPPHAKLFTFFCPGMLLDHSYSVSCEAKQYWSEHLLSNVNIGLNPFF
jgi:hypothetical protein